MKAPHFQVSDKVVLAYNVGRLLVVPQLVPGRLYCVCAVGIDEAGSPFHAHERVCLVGVRVQQRYREKGMDDSLPADYFRLVSGASSREEKKGGA